MTQDTPVRARRRLTAPSGRGERRGIQIGPHIRVGGWAGHTAQKLKVGLGKLDKKAAPFVAMIPGVGQIAAPIMNIAGNAMDTSNGGGIKSLGDIGRVGLESAAMYGGGKLLSKIPVVGSALKRVSSALPGSDVVPQSALDGLAQVEAQITGGDPSAATSSSPGVLSRIASVGSGLIPRKQDGSIDWEKLAQLGLGAGAAYEGVQASHRESAAQKEAMALAQQDAAQRAKLLGQGTALMSSAQRPDLSSLFDTGNPYSPRKRPVAVGAGNAAAGGY